MFPTNAPNMVIEPYLDDKQQLQWRVLPGDPGPKVAQTEIMKAEQGGFAGVFSDAMPAVGGGMLAAFGGAVADGLLAGQSGMLGNLGKAVPRVAAAWAIHQWARSRWPTASKYAIAFLIYDAAKGFMDFDATARGFAKQLTGGLNLAGLGRSQTQEAAVQQTQLAGDPLTAGW